MSLNGKTVAILLAPRGSEDAEFTKPKAALEAAGAKVVVVGMEAGEGETFANDLNPVAKYPIDATLDDVSAEDFDLLVVPGGTVGADKFRLDSKTIAFTNAFGDLGKPVAAICHAPWLLIEAGLAKGRRLTSYKSLRTDLENAGAIWVDVEVAEDNGVITSRDPDDLPAFNKAIIAALSERMAA